MNLRTYIVKGLYPLCSNEVQILLDQMQNNPEKFTQMFDTPVYRTESPWYKAMQSGNFELIDHVALRQQLKLLKVKFAKQLILEGLMEKPEVNEGTTFFGDSLVQHINAHKQVVSGSTTAPTWGANTPSKLYVSQDQLKAAKAFMDKETRVKAAKARK